MENKDYKSIIRDYEKLHSQDPETYKLSFDDEIARLQGYFKDYMPDLIKESREIEVALLWLAKARNAYVKYYQAFKSRDMEYLNDVLFETAHAMQMGGILSAGCDHGFFAFNFTPNLLAANMFDRIKYLLPEEHGISKNSDPASSCVAYMLMSLMSDRQELKDEAKRIAEKRLKVNNSLHDQSYIECMLAILNHDYESFNWSIQNLCYAGKCAKWYGITAIDKKFCIDAHGLYNLACWAYGGEMRDKILLPDSSNFCQDLAIWQKEHNFITGKQVHIFPEDLDFYNRLMKAKPVKMPLCKSEYSNKLFFEPYQYLQGIINLNNLKIQND